MNKVKKVLNVLVDVLIVLVLIISALTLISVFSTTRDGKGVPNIFGKAPVSVLTDSMKGDKPDSFNQGDLLICDVVQPDAVNSFKVGDVVTFRQDLNGDGTEELITHRLYKQNDDGSFQTKGDNAETNATYDQNPANSIVFGDLYPTDILAVYHGARIPGVGNVLSFIRSPLGFFLCILLPMIIFFVYQAIRVITNVIAYNKEKAELAAHDAIANSTLTEEQKEKVIAEYLAKQNIQVDENDSDTGE